MLPVILLVAALAATALGSPSGTLPGLKAKSSEGALYTVQVLRNGHFVGPAALISDQYAICSARIIPANTDVSSLAVLAGTGISFWINPFGERVGVAHAALHPEAGQGADVAILTLAKPISSKSARVIPVPDGGAAPLIGSRAVVTGWGSWSLSLSSKDEWLVLPRYCDSPAARPGSLCVTGDALVGALLAVDGRLAGIAPVESVGPVKGLASFVNLADPSVQKFINDATGRSTEKPSTAAPPATTTRGPQPPRPSTTAAPASTEAPKTTTAATTPRPSGKTCKIHVNGGLPTGEPILLRADKAEFRDPDSGDAVVLQAGESIRFVCSGKSNAFKLDKTKKELTAKCVEDDAFLVSGQRVELHQLGCKTVAFHSTRRNGTCGDQGQFTRVEIGFEVGNDFVMQIENCFDSKSLDAVYSRARITPAVAGHESGVKRPSFMPADFYEGLNPNRLYIRGNQQKAIGKLLGDTDLGKKYIKDGSSEYFLARGHFAAKADFILGAQQRATFYYINAAPQWQTFNGDNWEKLESNVRDYVISSGRSVQVVTGTWGTATLPNKDGVETELYLEADKKVLRVPKYYWKVVHDPATNEAVAFVGLNNPYHTTQNSDIICTDVCSRYTWLKWSPKDQQAGIGFCCDVNELRKVVTTIPADLTVQKLL